MRREKGELAAGTTGKPEQMELARLRAENARLRMERDIAKKASVLCNRSLTACRSDRRSSQASHGSISSSNSSRTPSLTSVKSPLMEPARLNRGINSPLHGHERYLSVNQLPRGRAGSSIRPAMNKMNKVALGAPRDPVMTFTGSKLWSICKIDRSTNNWSQHHERRI